MTTVIRCSFLTWSASLRDLATGSYNCPSVSSSINVGKGGEFISACNSAYEFTIQALAPDGTVLGATTARRRFPE